MDLTQSQFSLWMGQKLNPEVPLYNTVYVFTFSRVIQVEKFKTAFQQLIDSSDTLRTVFYEENGNPYQKVQSDLNYELEYFDFSNKTELQIQNWIKERSQKNIDLSQRVFDSVIIKISEKKYKWVLNIHHIITDVTSFTILSDYMCRIYKNAISGGHETLEPLPDFKSYISYETEVILSEKSESIKSYWRQKINGLWPKVQLYGRSGDYKTTKSNRIVIKLNQSRLDKLDQVSNLPNVKSWSKDLTLFNIFSTILFIYVKRISGENNLIIGSPTHNRISKTFKRTPGLFVEFFPLIADVDNEDSFKAILDRIKIETNNYLRHAQPGMSTPDLNKSYSIILNYINASFSNSADIPMSSEWLHPEHCDPNHYMRCHIYDMDQSGNVSILLDLNEHIFDDELKSNVSEHFLNVFDACFEDLEKPIGEFSIASQHEIASSTKFSFETEKVNASVLERIEEMAEQYPNAIALQYKNETLTYRGLNKRANKLAHYLKHKDVNIGDTIAIYNHRNTDYIISILAVMKLGATFVPIASDQPKERIDFIIANSNCALVLTNSELRHNIINPEIISINIKAIRETLENESPDNLNIKLEDNTTAYILYTSGSTGNPKGVLISNKALNNYIFWAKKYYDVSNKSSFALFTSIGFDLTITSTFLPLVSGGRIVVYKENNSGPDISVLELIKDNIVDTIKLTPSHLEVFKDKDLTGSVIEKIIVGGENFKVNLAESIIKTFRKNVRLFNEYGPTEATVGCIATEYNPEKHKEGAVPIGKTISNMHAYILDDHKNIVPKGVVGELYLSGLGLADGYLGLNELSHQKFIDNPFVLGQKMYCTGDLVRLNKNESYEYLGRVDEQVKLRGYRIELTDIETNLNSINGIDNCAVVLAESNRINIAEEDVINCTECGLPSNYPETDFDDDGVCHLCTAFKTYEDKAEKYFKTEEELQLILTENKEHNRSYDCLSLLSGGKDSTYILAQLVSMGLRVLAFTLDNGYISDQAKSNINRIVEKLGVDHIYGKTPHMNEIFIDSLNRHQNVCNGCFKTIYTLSTKIALEKEIPYIVTGLSRGQFFETRLTEELFWHETLDVKKIDDTILEVRKLYHREDDAVKDLLEVEMFEDDAVFDKVQFIDFYRYSDVSLEDMLIYLDEKVDWVRPTDTGRSTNCTINQVGIYVHKKEKGYSNYSFPYSWDVRLGHKTRDESLEEINEYIDEVEVKRIMEEIGYEESDVYKGDEKLVAYYTGNTAMSSQVLKKKLAQKLPVYMIPSNFKFLNEIPLTKNGKIDKKTLKSFNTEQLELETTYVAPRNEIDELVENVWKDVLRLNKIGIHDNFIALGGHSLAAIRVTSRINDELGMEIPLNKVFNLPTIEDYSNYLEKLMVDLLEESE